MSTLTDFLLERVFEREALIRYAQMIRMDFPITSPEEMLAECEAKRRIVEGLASEIEPAATAVPTARWVAKILALPYADHPDYREEWRP